MRWSVPVSACARSTVAAIALSLFSSAAFAADVKGSADWPQFRGPNGSGVAESGKPPIEFGPEQNVNWKVACAPGLSAPTVSGDQIYLTTFEDGELFVVAHGLQDGAQRWKHPVPAKAIEAFHKTEGSPAASSVATDGKHVVAYFGSYGLLGLTTQGKVLWTHELPTAETHNGFGTGVSPILVDGDVILVRDLANDASILSLDAATGRENWKVQRPSPLTAYGTPIIWATKSGPQLVVPGAFSVYGYDVKTGKELWFVRDLAAVNCTTPVISGDLLVYGAWAPGDEEFSLPPFSKVLEGADQDGNGALSKAESVNSMLANFFENNDTDKDGEIEASEWQAQLDLLAKGNNRMVAIKPGAQGDATKSHVVWERKRGLPYVPSILAYQNRIYCIKDGGILTCLNAETGKPFFDQKRLEATGGYYASPIAANGYVYLSSLEGIVTVLKASDSLEVAAQNNLGERISCTPAVVGNTLIVRSANHLWSIGK